MGCKKNSERVFFTPPLLYQETHPLSGWVPERLLPLNHKTDIKYTVALKPYTARVVLFGNANIPERVYRINSSIVNTYPHICGSRAFFRLFFLFSRLSALSVCPYRAVQATDLAGGYDCCLFGSKMSISGYKKALRLKLSKPSEAAADAPKECWAETDMGFVPEKTG